MARKKTNPPKTSENGFAVYYAFGRYNGKMIFPDATGRDNAIEKGKEKLKKSWGKVEPGTKWTTEPINIKQRTKK